MASAFNADDILTSSGKYPERAKLADAATVLNATLLASKVARMLLSLGYEQPLKVSSGFRPPAVNAATPGAAKRSLHMTGQAVDFEGQELGKFIRSHPRGPEVLRAEGLFMEALEATPTWVHIDMGVRPDRKSREFRPA